MATTNMHNLTTLIKRLEAATARLEDIASSTIELPQAPPLGSELTSSPPVAFDAPTPPPPPQPTANATSAPVSDPLPESIEQFDAFINETVDGYVKLSKHLGGLVAEQASEVLRGFQAEREFLLLTTKARKPDLNGVEMNVYQDILKPINEALVSVTNIKEANRGSPVFAQLCAVAEGIMVLAWVTVDNRPWKHVEESLASAQFFGNRVLKEQKDKDPQQAEWVNAFYQVFRRLADYVKQHFHNGIPWNPKGRPAGEVMKSLSETTEVAPSAHTSQPGGLPPPPPPPGPAPVLDIQDEATASSRPKAGLDAVFSELNKGDQVTKGLRKVDKSEMTHKNPSLRAGSTVGGHDAPRGKSPAPGKKPKPESMRVKKPAKKELDGNKWIIENYDREPQPMEIEAAISHSILISRCNNTTIIVKGKANAVTIENSNRLSLIVDTLVSTVDVIKSQNFALQILGTVPTVMMDQVDGGQIYLSNESSSTKIFTSKSSGINLNVAEGPEHDYVELPLPYQICSFYDPAKKDVVHEIVCHAG
ncbi:adenylyl cyclase-associated protein [Sodiomyces alkalinus F11]|uniref:Adenylyl cyclase-associated protein n=1 Tax=Sodiomyces alkalinus (strain CBS 110278 / VKM F-3762 / F11) TaxID=1314773 RepID=A0A3N2PYC0_SODAK|nr:adenylyl cyclase-associated protein [Sodiomyces alkalinus F11]ROT39438.1 adenylyl cyclase-associated protein [Sodiomyces alkalinus F11]